MMLVGTFAAAAFASPDGIVAALRNSSDAIFPGFGVIMLVTSFLGLITITSLNFYGASLTLLSVVDSLTSFTLGVKSRIASLLAVFRLISPRAFALALKPHPPTITFAS